MTPIHPCLMIALAEGAETTRYGGTNGPDLTQYGIVVAAMLVVTGLLAWGFKRLVGGTLTARAAERSLQVMDVLPLGGKQKLCVVRCYDRTFFVGVTDRAIELISELDSVIKPEKTPAPKGLDQATFLRALQAIQKKDQAKQQAEAQAVRSTTPRRPAKTASKLANPSVQPAPAQPTRRTKPANADAPKAAADPKGGAPTLRRRRVRRPAPKANEVREHEFPPVGGLLA